MTTEYDETWCRDLSDEELVASLRLDGAGGRLPLAGELRHRLAELRRLLAAAATQVAAVATLRTSLESFLCGLRDQISRNGEYSHPDNLEEVARVVQKILDPDAVYATDQATRIAPAVTATWDPDAIYPPQRNFTSFRALFAHVDALEKTNAQLLANLTATQVASTKEQNAARDARATLRALRAEGCSEHQAAALRSVVAACAEAQAKHADNAGYAEFPPENATVSGGRTIFLHAQRADDLHHTRFLEEQARAAGFPSWWLVLLEEVAEVGAESDPARRRAELVQVAAVCVRWVMALDRVETRAAERHSDIANFAAELEAMAAGKRGRDE